MKKLYLLLALAVAGMHVSFAQLIWHPNLGTPPSEQVSLSWDDTSYTIVAEDGDEFSPGNAVEEMNRDRKSTRLNSSHVALSRMPSSA